MNRENENKYSIDSAIWAGIVFGTIVGLVNVFSTPLAVAVGITLGINEVKGLVRAGVKNI